VSETLLSQLVETCRRAVSGPEPVSAVRTALAEIGADPARALAEIPAFDGEDYVVHNEPGLSVFIVRQAPDTAGPPHDHGMNALIAMLEGVEVHRHYRRDGDGIALASRTRLAPGEVLVLDGEDVHAIANPDGTPSLGIHVYLGDIVGGSRTLWDPVRGTPMRFTTADYDRFVTKASETP